MACCRRSVLGAALLGLAFAIDFVDKAAKPALDGGATATHPDCSICLNEMTPQHRNVALAKCKHSFHVDCLAKHVLAKHKKGLTPECPYCRGAMADADKLQGPGKLYDDDGNLEYDGNFQNGLLHGIGTIFHKNSTIIKYSGEFEEGRLHGFGKEFREDGSMAYEGVFSEGKRHGKGKTYHRNGNIAEQGLFRNGRPVEGKFFYEDGSVRAVVKNGVVKKFREDGSLEYEGGHRKGQPHGAGAYYYKNGKTSFDGRFRNGRVVAGTMYLEDGTENMRIDENKDMWNVGY